LSNLDTNLRQELRREIQRICRRAGITTVYVTHDQKEALSTADRIAVMQDGRLVRVGTPQQLYRSPSSAFVAEFMGPTNRFEGEIVPSGDGSIHVTSSVGEILAAAGPAGGRVTVSIRPECARRRLRGLQLRCWARNLVAGGSMVFAFTMLDVSDSLILAQKQSYWLITEESLSCGSAAATDPTLRVHWGLGNAAADPDSRAGEFAVGQACRSAFQALGQSARRTLWRAAGCIVERPAASCGGP